MTRLPLPQRKEPKAANSGCNRGLYFSKFFNHWEKDFTEVIKPNSQSNIPGGKRDWLTKFEGKGHDATPAAKRIANIAGACHGKAKTFTTTGPFITGMGLSHPVENGFLWHHTLGVPYVPGSSIKGMIRAWAEVWLEEDIDTIWRLFGGPIHETDENGNKREVKPARVGNIIVFDALPVAELELFTEILTPHDGGWRISPQPEQNPPADWISPVPIPFLAIRQGAQLQFALGLRTKESAAGEAGPDAGDLELAFKFLEEALEWIGAGAKTAVGFGRFVSEAGKIRLADELKEIENRAPPNEGDRVQVSTEYTKAKLRGKTGTCRGFDEFGDMLIGWDGGGESPVPPDSVKKVIT